MSSYTCRIKIKATGEIVEAVALDDYLGSGEYGYRKIIMGELVSPTYPADEVEELEPIEPPAMPEKAKKVANAGDIVEHESGKLYTEQDLVAAKVQARKELAEKIKSAKVWTEEDGIFPLGHTSVCPTTNDNEDEMPLSEVIDDILAELNKGEK